MKPYWLPGLEPIFKIMKNKLGLLHETNILLRRSNCTAEVAYQLRIDDKWLNILTILTNGKYLNYN